MQRRDCAIDAAKRLGANACAKRGLHASFGGEGRLKKHIPALVHAITDFSTMIGAARVTSAATILRR
jgi:hypothetical protein